MKAQAISAINSIKANDVKNLAAMKSPPKPAIVLLNAVCALFGMEESWEESKKLMANKAFFDHMINYDVDSMPMKLVRHVQTNYTEHKENSQYFIPANAIKVSAALQGLAQWVTGVILYRSI